MSNKQVELLPLVKHARTQCYKVSNAETETASGRKLQLGALRTLRDGRASSSLCTELLISTDEVDSVLLKHGHLG